MKKSDSISTSNPLQVAMEAPIAGPRLVAVGKEGPAFEPCGNCRGFETVKVRVDGRLISVHCPVCAQAAGRAA
ncbi:hypothetical protein [Streptomyces nanshensis]|uniref:Uncharacterized protein n=1 Tax=Streptomyces nanshensis TaxID=518642 RepID=A0A1E7L9Z0_9ACTN|nr:hypothetical protein [Streptomyces nanshensis]OEV13019.1 hypothetical protein AN218_05800 [Streptomyces nanshensis]